MQPAVREETGRIAFCTAAGTAVVLAAFALLHRMMPEKIPFGLGVLLSGILGAAAAIANFWAMGLTVQKILSIEEKDEAKRRMRASYRARTLAQVLWVILAAALPFLNMAAGVIPLFIPGLCIRMRGIQGMKHEKGREQKIHSGTEG